MCFRPAIAEASFMCPNCDKKINPIMGQLPKNCPFCEADISREAEALMASSEAAPPEANFVSPKLSASNAAPTKPSASAAPKPPSAPGSV